MNKYLLITALAFSAFLFPACSERSSDSRVKHGQKAVPDTPEGIVEEATHQFEKLVKQMEACNSGNADKQAKKIEKQLKHAFEAMKQLRQMEDEHPSAVRKLEEKGKLEKLEKCRERFGEAWDMIVNHDFYGSTALEIALENIDNMGRKTPEKHPYGPLPHTAKGKVVGVTKELKNIETVLKSCNKNNAYDQAQKIEKSVGKIEEIRCGVFPSEAAQEKKDMLETMSRVQLLLEHVKEQRFYRKYDLENAVEKLHEQLMKLQREAAENPADDNADDDDIDDEDWDDDDD